MRTQLKEVQGIDWGDGAVMNCAWTGPLLRDVLGQAGVEERAAGAAPLHVCFSTRAQPTQDDAYYGGSIGLGRALDGAAEVVLALQMNGAALTAAHGHPLRVVVPGVAGARSVKWLDEIVVRGQESACFYQRRDYKVLPPAAVDAASAAPCWDVTPALQCMPVNSVVGRPAAGSTVRRDADGCVEVGGYALPGGDHGPVVRVEVSGDGGETWVEGRRLKSDQAGRWSWCLWTARVKVEPGRGRRIVSRATDGQATQQDERSPWNLRGVCYNGYGEVRDLEVV